MFDPGIPPLGMPPPGMPPEGMAVPALPELPEELLELEDEVLPDEPELLDGEGMEGIDELLDELLEGEGIDGMEDGDGMPEEGELGIELLLLLEGELDEDEGIEGEEDDELLELVVSHPATTRPAMATKRALVASRDVEFMGNLRFISFPAQTPGVPDARPSVCRPFLVIQLPQWGLVWNLAVQHSCH